MSYSLEIVAKAKESIAKLELWLQEDLLDELDRVAADPHMLRRRGLRPGYVHDFTRVRSGTTHYIFLVMEMDATSNVLSLRQVGHVQSDKGTPSGSNEA